VALELMGKQKGDYKALHPNTTSTWRNRLTTPIRPRALAIIFCRRPPDRLARRARLCLQSKAVESATFSRSADSFRMRCDDAGPGIRRLFCHIKEDVGDSGSRRRCFAKSISAQTAIGTGINADPRYAALAIESWRGFRTNRWWASNLTKRPRHGRLRGCFPGVLKRVAVKLSKICNDLVCCRAAPARVLAKFACDGAGGILHHAGQVNPVIEVVNQVAIW